MDATTPDAPDVTVVVAVYNPGPNIDGLLASLHAQALPPGALEVVLVDDGSTDGTLDRLQRVAQVWPYLVVRSIPNSGWPGRPRNIGLDTARGEYVFFADHDDEFFPEALSRMVSMAWQNRADIVVGKVVRTGRPTPYWPLAHRDLPVADPAGEVLTSRTVHKLYRRQWLLDLGARFPEGRVRLEDHAFTAQVLPHARCVSVLASYPCYRWIHRPDGTNSSDLAVDPGVYWEFYSGVLRTFEREAGPGRLLDEARRYAALQCFSRFPLRNLQAMNDEERAAYADAVHQYVAEQVPTSLDPSLPVLKRLRLQALRDGDTDRFLTLHEASSRLTSRVALAAAAATWQGGRIPVQATSELVQRPPTSATAATPQAPDWPTAALQRVGADIVVPTSLLGDGAATGSAANASASAADRSLLPADRGSLELTVRHRASGVEWPLPGDGQSTVVALEPGVSDGAVSLCAQVSVVLDPATAAFGRPLEPGIWDVLVRSQFLGEHQTRRLPTPPPVAGGHGVVLPTAPVRYAGPDSELEGLLYRTTDGTLALKVTDPVAELAAKPRVTGVAWADQSVRLQLTLPPAASALAELADALGTHEDLAVVVRVRGSQPGDVLAEAPVDGGTAVVGLPDLPVGTVLDLWARTRSGPEQRLVHDVQDRSDGGSPAALGWQAYATDRGSFSLKRVRAHGAVDGLLRRSSLRRLLGR